MRFFLRADYIPMLGLIRHTDMPFRERSRQSSIAFRRSYRGDKCPSDLFRYLISRELIRTLYFYVNKFVLGNNNTRDLIAIARAVIAAFNLSLNVYLKRFL